MARYIPTRVQEFLILQNSGDGFEIDILLFRLRCVVAACCYSLSILIGHPRKLILRRAMNSIPNGIINGYNGDGFLASRIKSHAYIFEISRNSFRLSVITISNNE